MGRFITIPTTDIITGNKNGVPLELNDGSIVVGTASPFEVYKSTDGGVTWSAAKFADDHPNKAARLHYVAANGNIYYGTALSGQAGYIVRSTDNGETFTKVLTVESSALWQIAENSAGHLFVAEYSMGLQDANELYGYNVWRSTDNGANWSKFYVGQQQSTPGAKDGMRHFHAMFCDSSDNLIISFGEGNLVDNSDWGDFGGLNYYLNADGTLGSKIEDERDNGILAFAETDTGILIGGGDYPPNRLVAIEKGGTTKRELMNITAEFGASFDSPFYEVIKGKDGVIYASTSGEGGKTPIVVASADDGTTWVLIYQSDNESIHLTCNRNRVSSRVYIFQGTNNYKSIPDYTRAELRALYTSNLTIQM